MSRLADLFWTFLKLGLTAFGGPIAHIGYFREDFVSRRKWLSDTHFGEIVSLCQFLPGPSSSQVGFLIGLIRGGPIGAVLAWLAFTLPSAIAMTAFAYSVVNLNGPVGQAVIHGLKLVAIIIVTQAVWGMSRNFTADRPRIAIAFSSFAIILLSAHPLAQLAAIAGSGVLGLMILQPATIAQSQPVRIPVSRRIGISALVLFFAILFGLPLFAEGHDLVAFMAKFYESGALVFGGGHVVLPLLETKFVASGVIDHDTFIAGYGATQAVPGPLFTFASYLGAVAPNGPRGIEGALIATVAIFLPGFLLVLGVAPFWNALQSNRAFRGAIAGASASVVGVLASALYQPIWMSTIQSSTDIVLVFFGLLLLMKWNMPSWVIVITLPALMLTFTGLGFAS